MGNVAFVIDHKWAIISILVVLISLCWVLFGKKWSNVLKVFCAGTFSIVIFDILFNWFEFYSKDSIDTLSAGFWNFIILIVSAPVAFAIWHFRDENNRQQIENQRKDINLKEFQKLSEWVSGAHLPEIKTVSKTTNKCNLKNDAEIVKQSILPIEYTTEETEEYSKQPKTADFDTFSKRDGAVALQISAIYNLLPFFRGDYGESFRLPAFNLLKSAWQAMQQDSLKKLEKKNLSDEALNRIFNELEQKANSPMGVALTQVLLSLNRENTELNLRNFREMLPNICLAGMNFHLSGVDKIARDLSGLNLQGANFQKSNLKEINLQEADLIGANFQGANLTKADLHMKEKKISFNSINININFQKADLSRANLQNRDLTGSNFKNAYLSGAILQRAGLAKANFLNARLYEVDLQEVYFFKTNLDRVNLYSADLRRSNLIWTQLRKSGWKGNVKITMKDFINNIYPDWKKENDPEWEALTEVERMKAMRQFCDETGMLIFDKSGTQIMPPP
ncbi:MAG: pentapeptide repeat-containing protein [Neisseria sp.]|nr:pentapeptide repeat-containing protein [Neisseria sp.]